MTEKDVGSTCLPWEGCLGMFNRRKKKAQGKPGQTPQAPSKLKNSLLSLEQRLMFDAAAAATASEVASEQVAQEQAEAAVSSDGTAGGQTADQQESQDLLQAIASYSPGESTTEIAFVDPTVPDYQAMIAGMGPNVEVVVLDGTRDGMEQIAESLAGRTGIDAIHLISHGDPGQLSLGTGTLTQASMAGEYADELATIKQSLSEAADILVYGCEFAEGQAGQDAATLLSQLTGADVAASTDATGYAEFGGDWVLETQTGTIETTLAVTDDVQANWKGLLAETWMNASTGAVIAGPAGNDWYVGDSANNTPTAAGGGADIMYGAGGDDTLQGGSGNDILVGGTGNDTIYGNSDDDVILGGTGNDYLDGGSAVGKNTIIGGGGNDQMVGGSGADVFRFTGAQSGDAYTVNGGGATDIIDLSEFSTATITNSGGVITVDRGGGDVFTISHSNVETIITAATVGNHGPLADAGTDQTVSTSTTVTLTAVGSSDRDGNTLTYQWTQIEGPKVTLSSSTAASPTFTAPSSATTLQFVVVVSDGTTSHADTVTINVGAANSMPTITSNGGGASTTVSVTENTTTVTTVTATDANAGQTLSYSIVGGADAAKFTINSSTGSLSFATTPNYESPSDSGGNNIYDVTVQVSDGVGGTDTQAIAVTVTNANETPTDLSLSANTVAENAANGTVIGTVIGTDPDSSDTKTYSFTDSAGGRFAINSSTGQITVANGSLLNYETATSHTVTVRVTDSGGLTYDEAFTINLTNVNEAPTGADATITINEDTAHTLTTANFGFSDVDAGDSLSAVRIDSVPGAGTLTLSGVTVTAGQVIAVSDITAGNLVFTPAANANGAGYATFTFSVRDSTNAYDVAPNTLTVSVTAVNDAPVITPIAPDVTFVEGGLAQVIDATGTITDIDSSNFDGGVLTVSITQNGTADDHVLIGNFGTGPGQVGTTGSTVTYGGIVIGTFSGGSSGFAPLVISFNSSATQAAVQEVYRSIQFNNVSDTPSTSTRQITFGLTDGDGGTATPQTKLVYVQATNDAPTDLNLSGNTVVENAANGTVVGTISGTDPDSGDTKTYSLTNTAGGRFAINSSTGQITVADGNLLNYESATSHNVTVRVTDSGGLTYDETFTINLTNVNETPTDLSLSANTVAENAANGTVVGSISGTDPDSGDTKTYSLTNTAGGRFAINSSTGQITVANGSLLNYEAATSHTVTVRVTDSGGLTYDESFTINLTNVNEAPTGADATITISEDTLHTLTTANFGFSDVDAGDNLSAVRIDTVPNAGTLTLSGVAVTASQVITVADIIAGNLVFTPAADANGTGHGSFTFSVRDGNNAYDVAPNTLTFDVTAVNDAPVNTVPGAQTVPVDTPIVISGLSVNDVDGNLTTVQLSVTNGTVAVSLSGGATISSGASGTSTLTLIGTQAAINATLSSLTYQGDSLFTGTDTLTVLSTDNNGASDTDTVMITVSNNAPTNVLPAPQTVAEDTPLALSGLSVTDTDGNLASVQLSAVHGTLSITLSGATTISSGSNGSGTVTLSGTQADVNATLASLTYQGNPNFTGLDTLTITSTDSTGTTDTDGLSITVTPVNDTPTDLNLSANTVAENAANGTVVGTISGTDLDSGDTKTYSLTNPAGGRFSINSSTGVITVADDTLLNYEAATSHTVTVRVTDSGGLTYDETFTINLTDVNETPTMISLSGNTVAENAANGTVVGTASTSDLDAGDTHTYSLIDNAGGRFAINSATGQITVTDGTLLDYDTAASQNITVRTTDAGALTHDQAFTINLTNVNETPTDLTLSANTVAENAANGTVVGTISGTDPDSGDTKTYSFTDSAGGRFAINSSTGQITVANSSLLNYESATSHNVTVRVTDSGGLTYDEAFTINLTNVNEAPTGADATITINEDTAHTLTTANFGFSDVDAGDSLSAVRIDSVPGAGTLTLSGVTVTAGQVIAVSDITAGNLVFTPAANANGTGYATFTFSVRDSTNAYDAAPNTLTYDVTWVNDAPVNAIPGAQVTAEDTALIFSTGNGNAITISDVDLGGNTARITLTATNGTITLGSTSNLAFFYGDGVGDTSLSFQAPLADINAALAGLRFDPTPGFSGLASLQIMTDDQGFSGAGGAQTDTDTIAITVTAVNDAPTDLSLSTSIVAENAANGTVIGTVNGTDPDSGDTKNYSLIDTAGGRFAINSSTGQITVADGSLLNYESSTSHSVTVRVTDSGGLTYDESFTIDLTNVNEAPTGADGTITINEDTAHTLTAANFGFSDADAGDSLSAVRVDGLPGAGTLTLSGVTVTAGQVITLADISAGNVVFTPVGDANGSGYTSFTFSVRDSGSLYDSAPNTITFNVTPVNDAPIAGDDSYAVQEDGTLTVNVAAGLLANDMEIDGDVSAVVLVTGPSNGTLSLNADGSFVYTPNANFSGTDTFTYKVNDGTTDSNVATVILTVSPVNDSPTAISLSGTTVPENAANGTVVGTASTTDPDTGDTHTYQLTDSAGGRFAINSATGVITVADGTLLDYEAATSHMITVRTTDVRGFTHDQTFTISLTNVNEGPTLSINTGSTVAEAGTDTITASELAVADVDHSAAQLTYSISTGPAYGRLELTTAPGVSATTFTQADIAANQLIYVHDGSETTSDSFTFTVSDGAGGSLGATTVTLTITPVNDAPTITGNGGGSTAAINVAENVSAVTIVTGADVDLPAQTLTYSIDGGSDQALFTINATTGTLHFTAPPDFEVATDANGDNIYVVQVRVTDSQGATTTQTIQVSVTDVVEEVLPTSTAPLIPPVLLPTTPTKPTGQDPVPSGPSSLSAPPTDALPPSLVPLGARSTPSDFQPANAASLSTTSHDARPVFIPENLRKPIDVGRDRSGFIPNDDAGRPAFTVLPAEPAPELDPEPGEKPQSTSALLLAKLNEMAVSLGETLEGSEEHDVLVTRIAALAGTTLSAGFIVWALRSGALLASVMATMPAWRHFDPLPVLGGTRSEWERRRRDGERDQRAEASQFRGIKNVLDRQAPFKS